MSYLIGPLNLDSFCKYVLTPFIEQKCYVFTFENPKQQLLFQIKIEKIYSGRSYIIFLKTNTSSVNWGVTIHVKKSHTFFQIYQFSCQGVFNSYVNKQRWVGGQSIVYVYELNDVFTYFVCLLGVGGWSKKVQILFT